MPRAKRHKPGAEAIEAAKAAQVSAQAAPETVPAETFTPGDAHEPSGVAPADLDFAPPREEPGRASAARVSEARRPLSAVAHDERQGIRIAVEVERKPGQVSPRVFIQFRNDAPPSPEEKAILQAEGFSYRPEEKAWAAPRTAANLVVAKRAVNEITRLRGDEGAQLYI